MKLKSLLLKIQFVASVREDRGDFKKKQRNKIYGKEESESGDCPAIRSKDFLTDLEKHNTQYDEVKFVQLPHKNHDCFLIIDESVYLLGASVKDMGNGLCAVTKLQALPETILGMLK